MSNNDDIEIKLNAVDRASGAITAVGSAVEYLQKQLDAAQKHGGGLGSLGSAASKINFGGIAKSIFSFSSKASLAAGAGAAFAKVLGVALVSEASEQFASHIAEAASELGTFARNLDKVGHASTIAFSDSVFGSYFKKLLDSGIGIGNIGNMVVRDLVQDVQNASGTAPSGLGSRDFDPHDILRTSKPADRLKALRAKQADFQAEEKRLLGLGSLTTGENDQVKFLRRNQQQIRTFIAGMGFDRTRDVMRRNIFGAEVDTKGVGLGKWRARDALIEAFKNGTSGGTPAFTTKIGTAKSIFEGIADKAAKEREDAKDKAALADKERTKVIEDTRTPLEHLNIQLAKMKELFPAGGDVLDRAQAAARKEYQQKLQGNAVTNPGFIPATQSRLLRFGPNQSPQIAMTRGIEKIADNTKQSAAENKQERILVKQFLDTVNSFAGNIGVDGN